MQDVRYTLRRLRREPGFAFAAVLIIGLAVGCNTAIFSVVNTLLFQPLQFHDSGRLVWIANARIGNDGGLSSVTSRVANYQDWSQFNHSFEGLTAYFAFFDYGTYTMTGAGEPEQLVGAGVVQNFLDFLGVNPVLGRNFTPQECMTLQAPALILTHGLWVRRFASDPQIIGKTISLNDRTRTIVGVLPASFDFSSTFTPGSRVDMLLPFPLTRDTDRWGNTLAVIGRLKPGVTLQSAQAEFDLINDQIRKAHPDRYTFGAKLTSLQDYLTSRFRRGLLILLWAVAAVLLVACANLSNLLLARAASRRKEMAIRSALGASRSRLLRQMLVESLILSCGGAVVGLGIAWAAIRSLGAGVIQGVSIPLLRTVRMDGYALLFTLLATLAAAFLFGLMPALATSNAREAESLKDGGRGMSEGRRGSWTRSALVVSEVAFACVLLVGAGLLIHSFLRVLDVDLGFQPDRAASWRVDTPGKYPTDAQRLAFYDRLVRAVEAVPGVESAGITDSLPLSRDRSWGAFARGVIYPKGEAPLAHPRLVDWRYLPTMKIPLLAGREFNEHDTADSDKVIIINQKMATRLWPGQNPLGQMLTNGVRVVGVVGNVRHQALEEEGGLEMYLPLSQQPSSSVELVVRSKVDLPSLAPALRAALRGVDPNLPTTEYRPLGELVERAVSPRRFMVMLLSAFAVAALLLASVGIYGVVSYTVTQRIPEIGIRMALGASTGQVKRDVLRRTMALVGTGVVLGILGALVVARVIASLLYQLQPSDPISFGMTIIVLLLAGIAAGYLPARRASRLDPMAALRSE